MWPLKTDFLRPASSSVYWENGNQFRHGVGMFYHTVDMVGEYLLCLAHSFRTSCWRLHEPLVPTHRTASNEHHWRRPCFLEWASCCRSQHLWGSFLRERYSDVYNINIDINIVSMNRDRLLYRYLHCYDWDVFRYQEEDLKWIEENIPSSVADG